jgi:uncharacterized phiE125 gp8 family phage protein
MALRRTVEPTVEPLTLAEAKAHLNIFDVNATRDGYITTLISVARMAVEDRLQRALIDQTWELTIDRFPCAIPLRMSRVIAVTSVKYLDANGVLQTLTPSTGYFVDDRSEPGWIVPAFGTSWPATLDQINAVTVVYRCGYGTDATTVPVAIKQWMLLAIGTMFENRERDVVTPGIVAAELGFADHLLDAYRNWAL